MYHTGFAFGYTGGILASLLAVFLFVPLIPVATPDLMFQFDITTSILLFALHFAFGNVVGGTIGATRKNRRYVDELSNIFMSIFEEPD
jgi:hypothetical protein